MSPHVFASSLRRACAAAAFAALWSFAQGALADGTPFFSSAQVAQGRWQYAQKCGVCHGAELQGTGAPALKGRIFNVQWNGKKLSDLYSYVHTNMPLGVANSLPSQEYADIVAYILAQSGLPPGSEMLTPKSSMDRVLDLSDAAVGAPAGGSAAAGGVAGLVKIGELYGPLAQPSHRTYAG